MIRRAATALVTTLGASTLGAVVLAPPAAADVGQLVVVGGGTVRCLVSADDVKRGGGPMVVCQRVDGQPWGLAPWETSKFNNRLNLAVVRGTGEMYWERGVVPAPNDATRGDIVVDAGQISRVDGWTIQDEGHRTRFTYDATGHGIFINAEDVRQF
ncbi:hypothetical protein AU193_11545 [Mycobacterium sp. GA-1285]|uniref:hypothetical protein n=1 Tax=Mycobacterium sp. GA-1285 TaxID=1772282 RepID=UPI000748E302|nr:hypothetical protein [Mycobacterium sp. GA-1285]KUI20616.1 hypothetical protein AU193_11545 [Mycobacterium sp. GA-1285]